MALQVRMSPATSKKAAKKSGKAARPRKTASKSRSPAKAAKSARPAKKASAPSKGGKASKTAAPAKAVATHAHCAATDPFGDACQNLPRRPSKYCVIHSYLG